MEWTRARSLRSDSKFEIAYLALHKYGMCERTNNKRLSLPNTNTNEWATQSRGKTRVKFKWSESKCAPCSIRKFNLLIMIKYTKYNRTRFFPSLSFSGPSPRGLCGPTTLAAVAQCSYSWSFFIAFFNFFFPVFFFLVYSRAHNQIIS